VQAASYFWELCQGLTN